MNPSFSRWLAACASLTACVTSASADVRINEIMASNNSKVVPGAASGTFPDWVELYNTGTSAVNLGGWFLTDNSSSPTKWTFPTGTTIAAGGYLIILANNGGVAGDTAPLKAGFALSGDGEYLGLLQPDLTVVSEFAPSFPAATSDVSYGIASGGLTLSNLATSTPGAANSAAALPPVAAVTASVNRGFFSNPFSVTLSTATSGAAIYYTTDGSPPLTATGTAASTAVLFTTPIAISTTTILRSAAIKAGASATVVNTQSYIFPTAVAAQIKPASYPSNWGTFGTDYAVDTAVSQNATTGDNVLFQTGLRSIPSLSVSLPMLDMFGPNGVYSMTNSTVLEKAVSAEYFKPAATGDGVNAEPGFQIDCGILLQGGASRNATLKHSFSLRFRSDYGKGSLDYDLFKDSPVKSFSGGVQLRAMYNNSWTHGDAGQRARATQITDEWMRATHIDMGSQDGLRGSFIHLFINGLYWGVYNLHERPNDDHYVAYNDPDLESDTVIGYNPSDAATTPEAISFKVLRDTVATGTWDQISAKMDIDNYIDFFLTQNFGHNDDLQAGGNWRASGGGTSNSKWRFYLWDSERSLENRTNAGALALSQDGPGFIGRLGTFPEFQVRFADRAWKHLHHNGALTNAKNRARFLARVNEINTAIVGESARWGDRQTGGGGPSGDYTRTENWLKAVYGPLTSEPTGGVIGAGGWFPETGTTRTEIFETAWKSQTWSSTSVTKIPAIDPPEFAVNSIAQHGGVIPAGGTLKLTGGSGQVYYTTDGSDPRLVGGAVKAGLVAYPAGSTISLPASALVRTRWKNGTNWSALNEAFFFREAPAVAADLRITEIHYFPVAPSALETLAASSLPGAPVFEADDFQFLEIINVGSQPVNLMNTTLAGGITFTFGNTVLAPGARAVVVENAAAFAVRYGNSITPAGEWSGALAHGGETLTLSDSSGAVASSFAYSDIAPWPTRPDGGGSSLEIISPTAPPASDTSWRASVKFHGTPGGDGVASDGRIRVNEVLSNPAGSGKDTIELVNTTASPIDLSGWFLSDGASNYRKFRIPSGTVLAVGGYLTFDENQFNTVTSQAITNYSGTVAQAGVTVTSAAHGLITGDAITIAGYAGAGIYNGNYQVIVLTADTFKIPALFIDNSTTRGTWNRGQTFALSSSGEQVWILEGKAGGELVSFVDQIDFPVTAKGQSAGRWPDRTGPITLMSALTLGAENTGPTGYAAWAAGYGLNIADPNTDSDNDGIPDLGEYALGLLPLKRDSLTPLTPVVESGNFTLTYPVVAARTDVTAILEGSPDLAAPWTPVAPQAIGTLNGIESRKISVPVSNPPRHFFRYRFTR